MVNGHQESRNQNNSREQVGDTRSEQLWQLPVTWSQAGLALGSPTLESGLTWGCSAKGNTGIYWHSHHGETPWSRDSIHSGIF